MPDRRGNVCNLGRYSINLRYVSLRILYWRVKVPQVELDATDRRIIAVLQAEGRISNLELADRIGLSPTPCSRRLKRLEESGVILGYGARINPAALGLGISAIVSVRLARQSPADIEEFLTAVRRHPEITECLLVTGNLDYILRIRVEDVDALKTFILTKMKPISCVSETSTMLILEASKSMDVLPAPST
jgi:Lrp/AsnC family transcriptional regulator, leucine-responsive regulatory protein